MIFKPTPPSNTVHSPSRVQRPETGTFSKIINWFRCHKNQSNESQDPSDMYWIPSYADFVIMYSMFDQKCGLIQTFLDLLRVNPHKNLMKILTDVNRQMMQSVPKMPCILSTLTKTLFFSKNALHGTRRNTKTEALSCFYEIQGSRLRGTSIIFNQVNCRGYAEPRVGSDKDAVALYAAHGALGLDIEPCDDYTSQEIREKLLDGKFTDCNFTRAINSIFFFFLPVSQRNHADNDCLFVSFMSHGGNDGKIVTRDGTLRVADLWESFNGTRCPSLVGKPKLFFIQACRGLRVDPGSTLIRVNKSSSSSRYSDDRIDCHGSFSNVPDLADMLIMYSTTEGHVAFRGVEGSWFFQTLCEELKALSGDILTILTEVNRKVAFAEQSSVQDPNFIHLNKKKQMPNINSMLTKNFFLTKEALDKARGGT